MALCRADFGRRKVPELRRFLADRGIKTSNKRKEELIELALKASKVYEGLEPCDHNESERNRQIILTNDGALVDINDCKVKWSSDLCGLPSHSLGDVFAYLVTKCKWSSERLRGFKMDDGYLMHKDNHVEMVELGKIQGHSQLVYIRGKVKPEQRQAAERYNTWLLCSMTEGIKSAGCACVAADDGSCKHVVALLFSLADYTERHTDKSTISCTDSPCQWSHARRESVPVLVKDLDFRHEKSKPKPPVPTPDHYKPVYNVSQDRINAVQEHLRTLCQSSHPGALILTILDPPQYSDIPMSLRDLVAAFRKSQEPVDFITFCVKHIPDKHIKFMQNLSQGDPMWKTVKIGRITASIAADIKRIKPTTKGKYLIDHILGLTPNISVPALDHGRIYEHVAREIYRAQVSENHKNLSIEECGLFVDRSAPVLGASPDGIVMCKCHEKRTLEIKCTYKHRNIFPRDIPLSDPFYHLHWSNNELKLKETSPWYYQIQYQMGVIKTRKCDFVIHSLRGIELIEIEFNETVWLDLKQKALQFFESRIFPSL